MEQHTNILPSNHLRLSGIAIHLFASIITILVLFNCLCISCFGEIVEATWWSSRTAESNLFTYYGSEGVRLGSSRSGFVEGTLLMPTSNQWVLRFSVNADESVARAKNDSVNVFLDGVLLGQFKNDPASAGFGITHRFNGDKLTYRFEFNSANGRSDVHQYVTAGVITDNPDVRIAGGVDSFGVPAEPAYPSLALAKIIFTELPVGGGGRLDFDQVPGTGSIQPNRAFGHTFANIPFDVESATLWIRVRGGVAQPDTDTIAILFADAQRDTRIKATAWERFLGKSTNDLGLVKSSQWTTNDYATVKLDLTALPLANGGTTNLIPTLIDKGFLDVVVSDDSGVDYVLLDLKSKPRTPSHLEIHTAVELDIQTELGKSYQIQGSPDLNTWSDFGDRFAGDGARFFKLISTRDSKYRFFRVVTL